MKLHLDSATETAALSLSPRRKVYNIISFFVGVIMLSACESRADFSYSDGSAGSYQEFSGKVLVINYWAEWCKPCIKEIPEFNQLAIANKNIRVIGVNYDIVPIEKEQALIKKLNIQFPVARAFLHDHYGYTMPTALPTTVIISPEGKVKAVLQGPQTVKSLTAAVSD